MTYAQVKRVDLRGKSLDPIELFTKYHIIGLRHTKNGFIRAVKHVQFGWMKPDEYYRLQKLHDLMPAINKFIEGGYRLKQAIYGFEIEILGTDIPIPVGAGLMATIMSKIALSLKDQRLDQALLWSLALALPFGEIAAIWRLTQEALGISGDEPWWGFGRVQLPGWPEYGVRGEPGRPGEDL